MLCSELYKIMVNDFTEKLKQSYNLCIRSECMQWSNRECRPSVWSAAAENFNAICKVKARLWAALQITSAQQHASIYFILPRLKLNRTGGSTHWRRKYKTRSIRSSKSDRLTTRIRCGHNKQSEATRSRSARLYSSVGVGYLKGPPPLLLEDDRLTRTASPGVSFAPKCTSTLGRLNEPTMSTRLHTAPQVNATH